jgi:hypothetical protein
MSHFFPYSAGNRIKGLAHTRQVLQITSLKTLFLISMASLHCEWFECLIHLGFLCIVLLTSKLVDYVGVERSNLFLTHPKGHTNTPLIKDKLTRSKHNKFIVLVFYLTGEPSEMKNWSPRENYFMLSSMKNRCENVI